MAYLDTTKYLDAVCRMLEEGNENVPVPVQGNSMRPFLRSADFAYLVPLGNTVKKGDIILFRRENGQYVLHRVYKIRPEGQYLMLGDSQVKAEPVPRDRLLAKVAFVRCAGQLCRPGDFRWWFFENVWRWVAPWRTPISRIVSVFRKKA